MKVRLVNDRDEMMITMKTIPRVGERISLDENDLVEVTEVTHTPTDVEYEAIVHVKRAKL